MPRRGKPRLYDDASLPIPVSGDLLISIGSQASVPRDVFPPTPPGPEGSNGNGLFRVQWSAGAWLFFCRAELPGLEPKRANLGHQTFIMTKRLYYDSSDIHEFDSVVEDVVPASSERPRPAIILRETAFYPTSGGQVHDTGWLTLVGTMAPIRRNWLRVSGSCRRGRRPRRPLP